MSKNRKKGIPRASRKQANPRWQRFLDSSGGTALITVLIGGLLGSLITSMAQSGVKTKEFQLSAYKEYLDQEREIIFHASELVGHSISASDDLIAITGQDFDPAQYPGVETQRLTIRKTYNAYAEQWRKEYRRLSFAMSYYHRGHPNIKKSWAAVQEATTAYMECARQWYINHNTDPVDTVGACKDRKNELIGKLNDFNTSLTLERQYVWQEWSSQNGLTATPTNNEEK